jgi:hypothetical protein
MRASMVLVATIAMLLLACGSGDSESPGGDVSAAPDSTSPRTASPAAPSATPRGDYAESEPGRSERHRRRERVPFAGRAAGMGARARSVHARGPAAARRPGDSTRAPAGAGSRSRKRPAGHGGSGRKGRPVVVRRHRARTVSTDSTGSARADRFALPKGFAIPKGSGSPTMLRACATATRCCVRLGVSPPGDSPERRRTIAQLRARRWRLAPLLPSRQRLAALQHQALVVQPEAGAAQRLGPRRARGGSAVDLLDLQAAPAPLREELAQGAGRVRGRLARELRARIRRHGEGPARRPLRSRKSSGRPSPHTTVAPTTRRGVASRLVVAGQGSRLPKGQAGSVAASATARPGRASRAARSRSTAPGPANCAPERPSTKWPRRSWPRSSISRYTR